MKKTFMMMSATAALFSAVALAEDPETVYTLTDINIQTARSFDLTSANLNTTDGYTLMVTVNWTSRGNGSLLWITTDANAAGNTASTTGGIGYTNAESRGQMAALLRPTSGAVGADNAYQKPEDPITLPSATDPASTPITTTLFLTSQNGTANLYELASDGHVYLTYTASGMGQGDIEALGIGSWNTSSNSLQQGTLNGALYSGVLSINQMEKLIPEPTTATLSLLALAGLAARRRRK